MTPETRKTASTVPSEAKREAEACGIPGVEAAIWTERMVSALVNGVEGGRWKAFFAAAGLFALYPAWQTERNSR